MQANENPNRPPQKALGSDSKSRIAIVKSFCGFRPQKPESEAFISTESP
jgi:hypothetical protein